MTSHSKHNSVLKQKVLDSSRAVGTKQASAFLTSSFIYIVLFYFIVFTPCHWRPLKMSVSWHTFSTLCRFICTTCIL